MAGPADSLHINYVTEEDPRCEDPGFDVKMFPHQLALAHAMLEFEQRKELTFDYEDASYNIHTNIGFLTDHLGAGKTLTALTLIYHGKNIPFSATKIYDVTMGLKQRHAQRQYCHMERYVELRAHTVHATLIIVPKQLKTNVWQKEIAITSLKSGEASEFYMFNEEELNNLDIILCSTDIYNSFIEQHDYAWRRVIIDDIDSTKFANMREPIANFTWLLTNTVSQLSSGVTKSGFVSRFTNMPDIMIDKLSYCSSPKFFRQYVNIKDFEIINIDLIGIRMIDYLDGCLSKRNLDLLRQNILIPVKRSLYNSKFCSGNMFSNIVLETYITLCNTSKESGKRGRTALAMLKQLQHNICKLGTFHCYTCSNPTATDPVLLAPCLHTICTTCAIRAFRSEYCLVCNAYLDTSCCTSFIDGKIQIFRPKDDSDDDEITTNTNNIDPKISFIMELLDTGEPQNMIVYATPDSQRLVYNVLKACKYNPRLLSPGKTACLEKMERGEIRVICANAKTVASGFNIPFVDIIVIYDSLTYENMRQAIGRGQRIGRIKKLSVYTFEKNVTRMVNIETALDPLDDDIEDAAAHA